MSVDLWFLDEEYDDIYKSVHAYDWNCDDVGCVHFQMRANGAAKWKAVLNLSTFRPEPFVAER